MEKELIQTPEFLVDPATETDAHFDITHKLTGDEKSTLFKAASVFHFEKDQTLFHQGEPHSGIYIIKSGKVRSLYVSATGKEFTLGYWTPGHFVGAPQMLGGGTNMWTSVAEQDTVTYQLSPKTTQALLSKIPNLALGLIDGLAYKAALYAKIVQVIGTAPITTRLALLLLSLADVHDGEGNTPVELKRVHSQESLATMVGSTRQAIAQVLDRMESAHFIKRTNGKIVIVDPSRLKTAFE